MKWFRFWTETLDKAKVQTLPDHHFKVWINLLCVASEHSEDFSGTLPPLADLSFRIRIPENKLQKHLGYLVHEGLIDVDSKGVMSMHDWEEWQRESDVSTERVRRFRERKKHVSQRNETVSETASEENRIEEKRTPPTPSAAAPPKREQQPSELDIAITERSKAIHDRHPAPRRDISAHAIEKHLRAILRKVPASERIFTVVGIDERHAGWCASYDWQKEGGQYAKSLNNWLAPTMERYAENPPPIATEEFSLIPVNGHRPTGLTFAERNEQIRDRKFDELMRDKLESKNAH